MFWWSTSEHSILINEKKNKLKVFILFQHKPMTGQSKIYSRLMLLLTLIEGLVQRQEDPFDPPMGGSIFPLTFWKSRRCLWLLIDLENPHSFPRMTCDNIQWGIPCFVSARMFMDVCFFFGCFLISWICKDDLPQQAGQDGRESSWKQGLGINRMPTGFHLF